MAGRSFAIISICIKEILTISEKVKCWNKNLYPIFLPKLGKKHEACQGFVSWLDRAASCFCALDTPGACKTQSASYFAVTPQNASSIIAFSDEAAPFHSAMKHCSVSLHNMKHSLRSYYEKMKNESLLQENALILIKSPQILRCKRSVRPPPEKENHLKHTAPFMDCYPQMEQTESPPQIGVSLAGRNVIKVLHKIKKIL